MIAIVNGMNISIAFLSVKTVVCSRYLFGLLLFGICLLFECGRITASANRNIAFTRPYAPITIQYVSAEILPLFFIPIMQAISFPLMYRFGAEKGRLYVICAIAVIIANRDVSNENMGRRNNI